MLQGGDQYRWPNIVESSEIDKFLPKTYVFWQMTSNDLRAQYKGGPYIVEGANIVEFLGIKFLAICPPCNFSLKFESKANYLFRYHRNFAEFLLENI